jgi:hypothetical protein
LRRRYRGPKIWRRDGGDGFVDLNRARKFFESNLTQRTIGLDGSHARPARPKLEDFIPDYVSHNQRGLTRFLSAGASEESAKKRAGISTVRNVIVECSRIRESRKAALVTKIARSEVVRIAVSASASFREKVGFVFELSGRFPALEPVHGGCLRIQVICRVVPRLYGNANGVREGFLTLFSCKNGIL